jgi:ABC-2 type transport system permease protein
VLRLLRVLLLLSIWRTLLAGKGVVSGMTLSSVLTYTLIAEVLSEPLACRTRLFSAFWDGSIATRFLRPLGVFGQFAAEAFGDWGFGIVAFSAPLLLCAPLLGVNPLPAGALSALLFGVSLALAIGVGLALEYIFAAIGIGLELAPYAVERVRNAIGMLLSGALIPLALLPWGLGRVFGWLPFAAMASAPLRIYTGTGDAMTLLALQAGWCLLLWPCANRLWRVNRERMVSYGG